MADVTPLPTVQQLHGNPRNNPQFAVEVKDSTGTTQTLACPKATRALVSLMNMEAVLGGAASHFGGPAAFAEMMAATHALMFSRSQAQGKAWHEMYHFINDAGHCENGIYALKANYGLADLNLEKLKGFRSIDSVLTGHGEAHLFPESVYISNGPLGSGLPQAQGLAAAEGLSPNPRTTICAISDGGCMEGEAKEALAAIPGLAAKGRMGPVLCMISDNNTKLSGRIDQDSFSMNPTFESLEKLGWKVTKVDDGHDLEKTYGAIEASLNDLEKDSKTPHLLWIKTIKGKGTKKTEESASGGHGFPLKKPEDVLSFVEEIYQGEDVPAAIKSWATTLSNYQKPESQPHPFPGDRGKVQKGVAEALIEKYEQGYPIVSVSADLQGSTGVAPFRKKFPQASFEVGVAESNMVSMGVGLSKQGYIPVVDTFSQFAVTKGALPLIMSGLSQGPIIGIYSHTGFQDAADGASHQALTYLSMTSAVPNVDVYVLTSSDEAKALIGQAIEKFADARKQSKVPRSQIFFLGRENYLPSYGENKNYSLGKAQVVSDNLAGGQKAVTLVAVGPMLENALSAQKELQADGIESIVVNPSVINHPDVETIEKCLAKTEGRCVTIEDHRVLGGFGAYLSHALSQKGISFRMKSIGVGDHFGRSAYTSQQLYEKYGLGATDVTKAAKSLL